MSTSTAAQRLTQAERVELTRTSLLDAAAELIVEKGYHATTAADIAHRAGYSRETVRVRFGSKLGLMRELLVAEYQQAFADRLPPDASAVDRLRDGVDQLAAMSAKAPIRLRAAYILGFEAGSSIPELRNDVLPWLQRTEAGFAKLLRAAAAEGSIREVDSREYARLLIAAATGGAFLFMASPDTTSDPAAPMRTLIDSLAGVGHGL